LIFFPLIYFLDPEQLSKAWFFVLWLFGWYLFLLLERIITRFLLIIVRGRGESLGWNRNSPVILTKSIPWTFYSGVLSA
jgi:hypothetical protein